MGQKKVARHGSVAELVHFTVTDERRECLRISVDDVITCIGQLFSDQFRDRRLIYIKLITFFKISMVKLSKKADMFSVLINI